MIATINSVVATGRRMKGSETFISTFHDCAHAQTYLQLVAARYLPPPLPDLWPSPRLRLWPGPAGGVPDGCTGLPSMVVTFTADSRTQAVRAIGHDALAL